MTRRSLSLLFAAMLSACVTDGGGDSPQTTTPSAVVDPNTVVIGLAGPFSGRFAVFGVQMRNGAEAAIAEINAAGGVLGRRLLLEIADDACDPATSDQFGPSVRRAEAAARALVAKRAVLVDGHMCSSSSIVASAIYAKSDAIMISPASANWRLTVDAAEKGWTHVFRTMSNDDSQGAFAGRWLAREYRGRRIALVHDDSSYGQRIAAAAKRSLNAGGTTEIGIDVFTNRAANAEAIIDRLSSANPDLVYFAGFTEDAANLLKRLRQRGQRAVFMGTDTMVDDLFWRISGAAGQGAIMTFPPDPRRHPKAQAAVAAFKARGIDPEGYTLSSYAAIQVWAEATRRAQSSDRDRIATTMRSGRFDTVIGDMAFDAMGDLVDPAMAIYVWDNGGYRGLPF